MNRANGETVTRKGPSRERARWIYTASLHPKSGKKKGRERRGEGRKKRGGERITPANNAEREREREKGSGQERGYERFRSRISLTYKISIQLLTRVHVTSYFDSLLFHSCQRALHSLHSLSIWNSNFYVIRGRFFSLMTLLAALFQLSILPLSLSLSLALLFLFIFSFHSLAFSLSREFRSEILLLSDSHQSNCFITSLQQSTEYVREGSTHFVLRLSFSYTSVAFYFSLHYFSFLPFTRLLYVFSFYTRHSSRANLLILYFLPRYSHNFLFPLSPVAYFSLKMTDMHWTKIKLKRRRRRERNNMRKKEKKKREEKRKQKERERRAVA